MRRTNRSLAILCACVAAWGAVVSGGFVLLAGYKATPGATGPAPTDWPELSRVAHDPSRANLVVLAHPRCPCTRATLAELERLMADCRGLVAAHVLFLRPDGVAPDWGATGLRLKAGAIPGVSARDDPGGAEALRFGAATSGQVLLYDRDGRLAFRGGITASRGHEGDNPGRRAITDLLRQERAGRVRTPVFGCSLFASPPREQRNLACRVSP